MRCGLEGCACFFGTSLTKKETSQDCEDKMFFSSYIFQSVSVITFNFCVNPFRYGYHITKNSYFICHDQDTIRKLFERLRNFSGPNSYPKECGGISVTAVRDLTTGFDSNQPNNIAVSSNFSLKITVSKHSLH